MSASRTRSVKSVAASAPMILAAYILGHDSRILRSYQEAYWDMTYWLHTDRGVPLVLDDLRCALLVLSGEIDVVIHRDLTRIFMRILSVNGVTPKTSGSGGAPGLQECDELRNLTYAALVGEDSLQQWRELGDALGELELEAGKIADAVGAALPFGRFRRFTQLLQELPTGCIRQIPVLAEWLRSATQRPPLDTIAFLDKLDLILKPKENSEKLSVNFLGACPSIKGLWSKDMRNTATIGISKVALRNSG